MHVDECLLTVMVSKHSSTCIFSSTGFPCLVLTVSILLDRKRKAYEVHIFRSIMTVCDGVMANP